jgi:hypothetical protein
MMLWLHAVVNSYAVPASLLKFNTLLVADACTPLHKDAWGCLDLY